MFRNDEIMQMLAVKMSPVYYISMLIHTDIGVTRAS
jgi:hypothetical protein